MKKANLSINTIIIAALALIVLIVLIVIFTGKASIFRQGSFPTCIEMGGECLNSETAVCNEDRPLRMITRGCSPNFGNGAPEDRGVCCLPTDAR